MSKNIKQSSSHLASTAGAILGKSNTSHIARTLAASVVAQTNSGKQTGKGMEAIASNVLKSDKYSEITRALAASLVSQSNKSR